MVLKRKGTEKGGTAGQNDPGGRATEARGQGLKAGDGRLTAADIVAIDALEQASGESPTTRLDLAELLMHPSTASALKTYRSFFDAGEVDVSTAIEALPRAIELAELERKLDVARARVRRNRLRQAEPIAAVVFGVHRLIAATAKGSRMRETFDAFLKAWSVAFPGGGAAAAAESTPSVPPSK